jgi:hypothetical protein
MKLPNIASDDLMLFGSLALFALGAAVVVVATTKDPLLAFGVGLVVFGLPAGLIAFLAAAETVQ